jgi:hypothetical protein
VFVADVLLLAEGQERLLRLLRGGTARAGMRAGFS